MPKLRFVVAVALVGACAFLGSLVGSTYLRSTSTAAAAGKRSPLAVKVAALAQRVRELETRVGHGPTGLPRRVRALEVRVGVAPFLVTPGGLSCEVLLIWSYLDRLRAALVASGELPLTHDQLCL
jgi:hypothetical protein